MAIFVNCLIQDMDSVAWVGPRDSAEFINCLVKNIRGHAILKHPLGRVAVKNSIFEDRGDPSFADAQVRAFRQKFALPASIPSDEIVFLAWKLLSCDTEAKKRKLLRADATGRRILRWVSRQQGVQWIIAAGVVLSAIAPLLSCEGVTGHPTATAHVETGHGLHPDVTKKKK